MATINLDAQGPNWRLSVERRDGALRVVENRQLVDAKQYAPEDKPRDPDHKHDYGQNPKPVLTFDLHGTLTPDWGYPLTSAPFNGVKAFLDRMAARGCCLHISSASLDNPDLDFNAARTRLVKAWVRSNGLPISFIGPNSEASVRIDDRATFIPANPDWNAIAAQAEQRMLATYKIDDTGLYCRRDDLSPVGDLIGDDGYPDDKDAPKDAPRGFSTPLVDVDFHRTLMPAWGTKRDAPPDPDGVDVIRRLYAEGFSIQISCGGWNPATVDDPQFTIDRTAWQRMYLRKWGIPYDRLVAKDDCDLWFDDKSIQFKGWQQADKDIRKRLGKPIPWRSNNPINEPDAPIKVYDEELAELKSMLAAVQEKKPNQPVVVNVHFPEGFGQVNVNEGAIQSSSHVDAGAVQVNNPGTPTRRRITAPDGGVTVIETE